MEEDEKPRETVEEPESLLSMLANEVKAPGPRPEKPEKPRRASSIIQCPKGPQPFGIPDGMLREI